MVEPRKKGFNLEDFTAYIVVNLLSRTVGFIMRSSVLIAGLISLTMTIISGATIFVLWIFLPALGIATLLTGIALLFSNLYI